MTAINIVTAICFALLTIEVLYVLISYIIKKRPEKIAFIRGFKKGKCVVIFFIAIPLISLGYWFSGTEVFESILKAITHTIGFVVLKYDLSNIQSLIEANYFYKVTIYYCCVLVTINAIIFALSFIGQELWRLLNLLIVKFTRKDRLFIFGFNENNLSIYKSGEGYSKVVVDHITKADSTSMYINKINFISCNDFNNIMDKIFKSLSKRDNKIIVIINTEDDENNLKISRIFAQKIGAASDVIRQRIFDILSVYVFGDPRYEAIYDDIVSNSYGCLHYKNKYRMIAINFIDKYPFTRFMNGQHIDYETSLINQDVDINVCMVGFGKPNQQIFLTSVANNQFLTATKNRVGLKRVKYHIFDRLHAENNKNLNHSYYRFKNECVGMDQDKYLPLPDFPADETYYHMDIHEPAFYNKIHEIVSAKKDDINFIIISYDNDLENIDMAQKLIEKRREWEIENLVIFVRVREEHTEHSLLKEKNVILIGNENECVYNLTEITNDKIFKMAHMRNEIYNLEYSVTSDKNFKLYEATILKNRIAANKKWFMTHSQLERESNLYSCLSLRSKLNLMGLDYCKSSDNLTGMTEDEYMDYYAVNDFPDTESYKNLNVEGKKVVKYTLNFPESRRKNLAILEHYRWNSFMISKGMIPASKEQILKEQIEQNGELRHTNGKNYFLRRHGNITTFEGLITFRQMIAERDNGNEADYDVIKYDYQLLDDAYWLLTKNGYSIVKRS